jgi:hypothetical protein
MGHRYPYEAFPADSVEKPAQTLTQAERDELAQILAGSDTE